MEYAIKVHDWMNRWNKWMKRYKILWRIFESVIEPIRDYITDFFLAIWGENLYNKD